MIAGGNFSASAKHLPLQSVSSLCKAFIGASCSTIVLHSERCGLCLVGRRVRSESLTASAILRPSGTSVECIEDMLKDVRPSGLDWTLARVLRSPFSRN